MRSKNLNDLGKKYADKLRELEHGSPILHPEMTVATWAEQWLAAYNTSLRQASYERVRGILANHICAHIGQMRLNTVRPLNLQQVINSLAESGTIKHVQQTMCRLFESAQENRLIESNPAKRLNLPQCTEPQSHRSLTARERRILLRTAESHRAGLWVLLLLYTGLRPGESAALNHADIQGGFLRIDKAVDLRTNEVKPPKSRAGIRSVPIPAPLAALLPKVTPENALCPLLCQFDRTRAKRPTGKRHTKQSLKGLWEDFAAAMEETEREMIAAHELPAFYEPLPPITPYDLRHTYCTDLARAGVPLVTASKLMGHSNVSITAKIYTHVDQDMAVTAVAKLNDFYGGSGDDQVTTRKSV